MDKMTFASYKFKPSDVIEGLNRYFAESKAFRYRRVPLEIKNGTVKPENYYVFRNIVFDVSTPKVKECGYYYLICDPEEVVGVAINWLREEHDIFYTPGMEVPKEDRDIFCMENLKETNNFSIAIDDFYVDDAAKEYEKETRRDAVPVAKVREALGIAEDSDIFECIKYRNHQLETLRTELVEARRMYHNAIEERNKYRSDRNKCLNLTGRRLADIRKASGMADDNHGDLVEYIATIRKCEATYEHLYKQYEKMYCELRDAKFTKLFEERDRYKWLYENLKNEILKICHEIFDCSNGDPEGTYKETLQDILTEYKRVLKLKNVAEDKTIKYKELARENEEKAAKYKVRLDNTERQLRWTEEVSSKRLEKCEDLTKEREKAERLEKKLSEIQDICER